MQIKDFLKEKLTEKDLNDYKIILNDFYLKLTVAKDKMFDAKNQFKNKKISEQEYKQVVLEHDKINSEYKQIIKNKAFKQNLKIARQTLKQTPKDSRDYQLMIEEVKKAEKLNKEIKLIIKEKGRGATLAKINQNAVEVEHLTFSYGSDTPIVLNDVNFKIKHGEYVTIIGHNGSGKSTLSKLLIGVLKSNKGKIKLFGNTMTSENIDQIRSFLGIVFQNPDNQFIGSTVRADIAFGLENKRVDPKAMPEIIQTAATKVGMNDFLDKEPLNLSGGQKQRVAIASALALNPDVLIFDEATSMLDPKGKREIKEIMVDLKKQGDKTILSITHDMDEILNADKVIVMNKGEMVRFGTPAEVLSDKEFLRSIHLDIPFVATVEEELSKLGFDLKPTNNMDDLVKQLCKK